MTYEQIIEREFRKAVGAWPWSPVMVELDKDAETINVWYRLATYVCDCDSDDTFIFVCLENPDMRVEFPIPADYLLTSPQ